MLSKVIFSFFVISIIIVDSLCYQNYDKFTSAEISIPFKVLNERDNVVLKTNILGEIKNCSIDIASSEQLLYFSKKAFKEKNLFDKKVSSIINQDGDKIKGYIKNNDIVFLGNKLRKSVIVKDVSSLMIKSKDENKIHSFGLAHFIKEENSIVHSLYNSHLISQRQFSILYSYPDWGTLSFGKEGTLVTDMKNLRRQCKAVNSKYWGCHLSGIYIENVDLPLEDEKIRKNNNNIEVNQDTIFDNGVSDIVVPEEVFDFFLKNFFKKSDFEEKKCKIYEKHYFKKIICNGLSNDRNRNDFEKFQRVHFVFDDIVDIYVLGKYLFDKDKNFNIVYVKKNDKFIIGKSVLSRYYMIYNYDEDNISFFGMFGGRYLESKMNYKEKVNVNLVSNKEYIRYNIPIIKENIVPILDIVFIFLFIGNAFILYILYRLKTKKRNNETLLPHKKTYLKANKY